MCKNPRQTLYKQQLKIFKKISHKFKLLTIQTRQQILNKNIKNLPKKQENNSQNNSNNRNNNKCKIKKLQIFLIVIC